MNNRQKSIAVINQRAEQKPVDTKQAGGSNPAKPLVFKLKNAKNCIVKTKINCTISSPALLDTGSTHSIFQQSFVEANPTLKALAQTLSTPVPATAVNGTNVFYTGKITCNITIGKHTFPLKAYISQHVCFNLILGMEFLQGNNVTLDFNDSQDLEKTNAISIKTKRPFYVKPQASFDIHARVATPWYMTNALVHESLVFSNPFLSVCPMLINTHSGGLTQLTVRVSNSSNRTQRITTDTEIACLVIPDKATTVCHIKDFPPTRTKPGEIPKSHIKRNYKEQGQNGPTEYKWTSREELLSGIKICQSLEPQQKKEMEDLIWEFSDIFHKKGTFLKESLLPEMELKLKPGTKPWHLPNYRFNIHQADAFTEKVRDLHKQGIIEPSWSNYANPAFLVNKPDGSYRFVLDLRQLNKNILPQVSSVPHMESCLQALNRRQNTIFSKFDLSESFYQIKLSNSSRDYCSFECPTTHSSWRLTRMPMGAAPSSSWLIKNLSPLLADHLYKSIINYLDDVILMSPSFQEHIKMVREVFQVFRKSRLSLNPKKTQLGSSKMKLLGYEVTQDGITPDRDRVKTMANFPPPQTQKQLKRILGTFSWNRRFIKGYAKIAEPLHQLLKKEYKKDFKWEAEQQEAFDKLKDALTQLPLLTPFDITKPIKIHCDASSRSLGFTISNSEGKPIAYGGKSLRPSEISSDIYSKELAAIVFALTSYYPELRAAVKVEVFSDQLSLKYLQNQRLRYKLSPKITRYLLFIGSFNNLTINFIDGSKNPADSMSRIIYPRDYLPDVDDDFIDDKVFLPEGPIHMPDDKILAYEPPAHETPQTQGTDYVTPTPGKSYAAALKGHTRTKETPRVSTENPQPKPARSLAAKTQLYFQQAQFRQYLTGWTTDQIAAEQRKDKAYINMISFLESGDLPESDKEAREILLTQESYMLVDRLLLKIFDLKAADTRRQSDMITLVLCVPQSIERVILNAIHQATHSSGRNDYLIARQRIWAPKLFLKCQEQSKACPQCQQYKRKTDPPIPLGTMDKVGIHDTLYMDILGPYPPSMDQSHTFHSYALCIVDKNTSFLYSWPLPDCKSATIAQCLHDNLFMVYGSCRVIRTDCAKYWESDLFTKVMKLFNISKEASSPLNYKSHGAIERAQQDIVHTIGKLLEGNHDTWVSKLKTATLAHNVRISRTTGFSPFYLNFGRICRMKWESGLPDTFGFNNPTLSQMLTEVREARHQAFNNKNDATVAYKAEYDRRYKTKPHEYKLNDLVLLYAQTQHKFKQAKKWTKRFVGPFQIIEISQDGFRVRLASAYDNTVFGGEKRYFHVDRLKPFHQLPPQTPPPEQEAEELNIESIPQPQKDLLTDLLTEVTAQDIQGKAVSPPLHEQPPAHVPTPLQTFLQSTPTVLPPIVPLPVPPQTPPQILQQQPLPQPIPTTPTPQPPPIPNTPSEDSPARPLRTANRTYNLRTHTKLPLRYRQD